MRTLGSSLLLAVLVCGCTPPQDQVSFDQAPILGGSAASVDQFPTVVAILNAGLCTGTLIAPDLVLTAAHCVSPAVLGYSNQNQVTNATSVLFDSTNVDGYGGTEIPAADTLPDPNFGGVYDLGHNDMGLIWLSQSVTDRTPSIVNRVHADSPVGISTTLIGFGLTDPYNQNSSGRLYYLANKSTIGCNSSGLGSDTNLLCYNQSNGTGSCSGDSGGPSFATIGGVQKVVGVTSFGDEYCQQYGAYTRTDAELSFLDTYAPELQCIEDGACNSSCGSGGLPDDPDCTNPTPCQANGVCEAGCGTTDPDCPDCSADGFCDTRCGSSGYPADPDCTTPDPCVANGVCEAGCGTGGLPDDPDCPDCEIDDDCGNPTLECIDKTCVPIDTPPADGELGAPCENNEDCLSGLCASGPGGKLCTEMCDPAASECPDGFDCLNAGNSGACWPAAGDDDPPDTDTVTGGCGVARDGSTPTALFLVLFGLALAGARRRRA